MGKYEGKSSNGSMTVWYSGENGNEHRLDVEFEYTVNNNGIGSYEYWGHMEYDEGTDYVDDVTLTDVYLVREYNIAKTKEDIPKNAFEIRENKEKGYWTYSVAREIDTDGVYEEYCIEEIEEKYEFENDFEGPDEDDRWDDDDWDNY